MCINIRDQLELGRKRAGAYPREWLASIDEAVHTSCLDRLLCAALPSSGTGQRSRSFVLSGIRNGPPGYNPRRSPHDGANHEIWMNGSDRFARFSGTDGVRANLKHKSIRGAVFMASGNAADVLVRMVSIAILARLLLPADFGLIAMVTALSGILDSFRDFGLSAATVQRPEITHRQVTNLFWVNAAVGGLLALALCAASPFIAAFYKDERLVTVTLALSLVFVWNGLTVQHEALLIRQLRQGELAAIRLFASVVSVVIAIALAVEEWGFWALVCREISRSAIVTCGVWLRCPWLPGLPRRHVGTSSLIRFGGELSFAHLIWSLFAQLDKLLIGRFFGATPLGMYRQAQQLLLASVEQLNGPIMGVAQPALSALQSDPVRYRKFYEKIVFLVAMGTLPLGLFVAVCAEEITLLMLGPAWREATVFVRIFGIAAAIRPAVATASVVLVTCARSTRYLAITIVHSVVLAIMLLVGLNWGVTGIALAYMATTFVLLYPNLYYSFHGSPATVQGFFSALRTPALAGLAMAVGLVALQQLKLTHTVPGSLLLSLLVGGAIYLAAIWTQRRGRTELKGLFVDLRAALESKRRPPALDAS